MPTRAKMIPYLRMETVENHTISGGTNLSSLNHESRPLPKGVYSTQQFTKNTSNADRRPGLSVSTAPSMKS